MSASPFYPAVALFDAGVDPHLQSERFSALCAAWPAMAPHFVTTTQLWQWYAPDLDGYDEWVRWVAQHTGLVVLAFGEAPCGPVTGRILRSMAAPDPTATRAFAFALPGEFSAVLRADPVSALSPQGPWAPITEQKR